MPFAIWQRAFLFCGEKNSRYLSLSFADFFKLPAKSLVFYQGEDNVKLKTTRYNIHRYSKGKHLNWSMKIDIHTNGFYGKRTNKTGKTNRKCNVKKLVVFKQHHGKKTREKAKTKSPKGYNRID